MICKLLNSRIALILILCLTSVLMFPAALWSDSREINGTQSNMMDSVRFMWFVNHVKIDSSGWHQDTYGWDTTVEITQGNHYRAVLQLKYLGTPNGTYDWWTVYEEQTGMDSILINLTDVNKADFKADIGGVSTFDNTSDQVIVGTNNDKDDYTISGSKATLDVLADFNPATTAVTPTDTTAFGKFLAVKDDSLIYQGSAAGLSLVQIDSILSANHGAISWGGCTGDDEFYVTVFVIDTANGDSLSRVPVFAQNATGAPVAKGITNDSGYAVLMLEGSVTLGATYGTFYDFDSKTATITANDTIVIEGYATTLASPLEGYAWVYAYESDVDGNRLAGVIVRENHGPLAGTDTNRGLTVAPRYLYDTTGADGLWAFQVLQTGEYDDTTRGFYYLKAYYEGSVLWQVDSLLVPDTGNINITEVLAAQ